MVPAETSILATLEDEIRIAAGYAEQDTAEATRMAYASDWRVFEAWCRARGLASLPALPAAVATFLGYAAEHGARASTIGRRCAAIRYFHRQANYPTPTDDETVKKTMRGIRRSIGTAPKKKAAATNDVLALMVPPATDRSMAALRDRALLLIGFSIAARRSELVALDLEDIEETKDGLIVTIKRSKTDQEAIGSQIAVPYGSIACPVRALRAWLEAAGITEGPIFRPINKGNRVLAERLTDKSVANIVKKHAGRLGLDPATFAGHSLRVGFCTSAATRGANLFKIMDVSRHKSVDTLRGYVRDVELFKNHAGAGLL